MLDNILAKALDFIYAGENERPVRALNFRPIDLGGLGLIHPKIKAKAFLIKNMYFELREYDCSMRYDQVVQNIAIINAQAENCFARAHLSLPLWSHSAPIFMANAFARS